MEDKQNSDNSSSLGCCWGSKEPACLKAVCKPHIFCSDFLFLFFIFDQSKEEGSIILPLLRGPGA